MKYFVLSDIHSFYDEMISALNEAGYDRDNVDHTIIILGDIFDRGPKSLETYNYLINLPKDRRIFVKGNHEELFLELLNKPYPDDYDFSNGTVKTFCDLVGGNENQIRFGLFNGDKRIPRFKLWELTKAKLIHNHPEIIEFLKSDEWKNYYEDKGYIFVHSFIPLRNQEYNPNWRNDSSDEEWYDARWGCPYEQYLLGLFDKEEINDKTLICGHWHCSDFHQKLGFIEDFEKENYDIFYSKPLIAIDGCTALSHQVNVLVIDEDNKCYQHNKLLKDRDMDYQRVHLVYIYLQGLKGKKL